MKEITLRSTTFAIIVTLAFAFSGCKGVSSISGKSEASTANAGKPNEPNVTFPELTGGNLQLSSLKGKVVLVNFWATWCDPCRGEIPELIDIQKKYAKQGFTVLGVAMDDEGKKVVQPFVQNTSFDVNGAQEKMSYPIMIGNEDIAEKFGGLIGFPTSVLISRDGKIVKRFIGAVGEQEFEKYIKAQLQLPSAPPNAHS